MRSVWALSFSLAATKEINFCSIFLQVLRCFTSLGAPLRHKVGACRDLRGKVSSFGNLRINDCYPSPRSLSQVRYVLHRLSKSRHPPFTLNCPVRIYIDLIFVCLLPVVFNF